MYNFRNLSDVEFEILCKDIMQKRLGITLYIFSKGRDGGIDIVDNSYTKKIVIQVKHYINSTYSNLRTSLKKEVAHVEEMKPGKYYVCCAQELTAANKNEIYGLFSEYMESSNDVIALQDINEFLENPDNIDIVRKHYKLWLESTNILAEVFNQSIFIDCESLLYNIENNSREFVATNCYWECLEILERERLLLLLGMPGTGKTVTTKMLALFYAANGYRIRYTTNGDLKDLKNALSANKDLPEIVLLDDCFGQHYFKMKESQGNELLALVKYILMNKNKRLIMNSRVTIYQQAKERFLEFRQFAEDKQFQIQVLDMGKISIEDRGKIFYNHLFFKDLPIGYYQDILNNQNYKKIVKHKNYTPRIMEFVTRNVNYSKIMESRYAEYILACLDNPTEIWQDEFSNKLQQEDRIFMTTLYSLTDTSIDVERLKRAYNYRLMKTMTIDTTRNVWEEVLKRLEGSMLVIVEKNGKQEIGVINPSVNDFLRRFLEENDNERENIQNCATEYEQIKRGFARDMESIVRNGDAMLYSYASESEKLHVILTYICKMKITNESYQCLVESFFGNLSYYYGGVDLMSRCRLFIELLNDELAEFYDVSSCIKEEKVKELLWDMSLREYQELINLSKETGIDFWYEEYIDTFITALNAAIKVYIEEIDVYDYCDNYDVSGLIDVDWGYSYSERRLAAITICGWIRDDVEDEIADMLEKLPESVFDKINISGEDIDTCVEEAEAYVLSYFQPEPDYDRDDYYRRDYSESDSALDYIFK
ncbi:MAG: restriction endonuclease [Lachnospiraceae bacterium]|nr:restriction endonuclease [Lachnospiraceae bacterium]